MGSLCSSLGDDATGEGDQFDELSVSRHGRNLLENLHYGYRTKSGRVSDAYDIKFTEKPLGVGASGLVYKAVYRETGVTYALKTLDKSQARSGAAMAALMTE